MIASSNAQRPNRKSGYSSAIVAVLTALIDRLDSDLAHETGVIPWSSPVPTFGDLSIPRVATLGINPSNREFVDRSGKELSGERRRFHTLNSLGIKTWADADSQHLELMLGTYQSYFFANPYDTWFKKLDFVIAGSGASYYAPLANACHLDLVPFATEYKWTELSGRQRMRLLALAGNTLGVILRDSSIGILILNGSSVVQGFQTIADVSFRTEEVATWTLKRASTADVKGYASVGVADSVSGIKLDRHIVVLGFNHNLQSSYGMSNDVILAIRNWIARNLQELC